MIKLANNSTDNSAGYKSKISDLNNQLTLIGHTDLGEKKIDFFKFMHYSHGFNHFHIHTLYHRHYLQSPRQSNYHNLLVLTRVHFKTTGIQCLCTFYCIYMYTQSATSRLAGQTSCQIIAVHLLSSIHVLFAVGILF